ncbi:MAG: type II toxin-antitoxin system VapC family toxin [Hyphomicrobiaceae bacterium]
MYLLDTNIISELRRLGRVDRHVAAWAQTAEPATLFLSVITALEIEIGWRRIARRDQPQGDRLRAWMERQVLPAFDGRILPVSLAVVRRCAPLHVPDPRPDRDSLMAATALVHDLILVSRNVADFAGTGVRLVNPFEPL